MLRAVPTLALYANRGRACSQDGQPIQAYDEDSRWLTTMKEPGGTRSIRLGTSRP